MTTFQSLLSHPAIGKLGWTLVHSLWQAAAVAAVLGMLLVALRKASANIRYLISCVALILMVALPIVTLWMQDTPASSVALPTELNIGDPMVLPVLDINSVGVPMDVELATVAPAAETVMSAEMPNVAWLPLATARIEASLPYLVLVWLFGVFGLGIWHLGGWAQLQKLKRQMIVPVADDLRKKARFLAKRLHIRQTVAVVQSALVQVPTVIGWLKPMILLPASALTGLSAGQLEALLAHELAHIRRHDYLVNMLQTAIEILGFYHPAIWWASRRIRIERENCCDDIATALAGDRVLYADALATMEELRGNPGLAMAASGGSLFERIRRVAGKDQKGQGRSGWIPAVAAALLLAVVVTLGASATQTTLQGLPTADDDLAQRGQPLGYQRLPHGAQSARASHGSSAAVHMRKKHPNAVRLPNFISDVPRFGYMDFALNRDSNVWMALDASPGSDVYDLLYIDSDSDGHLDDEEPWSGTGHSKGSGVVFTNVQLVVATDDGPLINEFNITAHRRGLRHFCNVSAAGCYESYVDLGGESVFCRLIDANANGLFNDVTDARFLGDTIALGTHDNSLQAQSVAKYITHHDQMYRLSVAWDGTSVAFSPATCDTLGTVEIPTAMDSLTLVGANGTFSLDVTQAATLIPAGSYQLQTWQRSRMDETGGTWTATAHHTEMMPAIVVEPDAATFLDIEGPFTVSLSMQRQGTNLSFNYRVSGRLGERIVIARPGSGPPAATLRVVDVDGVYVEHHDFGAEGHAVSRLSIPEPPAAEGGLLAAVEIVAPFELNTQPVPLGPRLHVATQPLGTEGVELIWEINNLRPYDGTHYRSLTAAFTGSYTPAEGANTQVEILASLDNRNFSTVGTVNGQANRFVHASVTPGYVYYYKLHLYEGDVLRLKSDVTMGIAGVNLTPLMDFEQMPLGGLAGKPLPGGISEAAEPTAVAVIKGGRPYGDGQRIVKFDPRPANVRRGNLYSNRFPLNIGSDYLQGGWVRPTGNIWLGHFFFEGLLDNSWGYSMPAAGPSPYWAFAVQRLTLDVNGDGWPCKSDGRPYGMSHKQWTYPYDKKEASVFLFAYDTGESDDNWIIEVKPLAPDARVQPNPE